MFRHVRPLTVAGRNRLRAGRRHVRDHRSELQRQRSEAGLERPGVCSDLEDQGRRS